MTRRAGDRVVPGALAKVQVADHGSEKTSITLRRVVAALPNTP
jgi:hypothetical protein